MSECTHCGDRPKCPWCSPDVQLLSELEQENAARVKELHQKEAIREKLEMENARLNKVAGGYMDEMHRLAGICERYKAALEAIARINAGHPVENLYIFQDIAKEALNPKWEDK